MISISLIQQGALCAGFGATLLLAPASLAQSKPQTPEPVPSSQPSTEESRPKPEDAAEKQPASSDASQNQEPSLPRYKGDGLSSLVRVKRGDGDSNPMATFDGPALHSYLVHLGQFAANYPPKFRSKDDRARAERHVDAVSKMLQITWPKDSWDQESAGEEDSQRYCNFMLLAGRLESMGHNLDRSKSAERAIDYFDRILAIDADHGPANLHYGMFLAGTARGQKKALPF